MGSPSIRRLEPVDFTAIVPVIAHAVSLGDEHKAHWLSTPTPTEVLQMAGGVARIETVLTRIEHNIPS